MQGCYTVTEETKALQNLAKITWTDPNTGISQEHVLTEGATAALGRSAGNDICIPDKHVSRRHAVITYRDGVFLISDLGSINGTFVNGKQVYEPFPLLSGDEIRLYVPRLYFTAADDEERQIAENSGRLISITPHTGKGQLIVTNGPQEGLVIPMLLNAITIGRATSNATWEIGLQDASVSRPHAMLELVEDVWFLRDLGSSNGTLINDNELLRDEYYALKDGDVVTCGKTVMLFRAS